MAAFTLFGLAFFAALVFFAGVAFFTGVAFFAGLAAFRLLNVSLATVANRVATMG